MVSMSMMVILPGRLGRMNFSSLWMRHGIVATELVGSVILRLIKCNADAPRDSKEGHRRRMFQELCSHDSIKISNDDGIACEFCGILFTITFRNGDLTFWSGEPLEEKDDLHDPA